SSDRSTVSTLVWTHPSESSVRISRADMPGPAGSSASRTTNVSSLPSSAVLCACAAEGTSCADNASVINNTATAATTVRTRGGDDVMRTPGGDDWEQPMGGLDHCQENGL